MIQISKDREGCTVDNQENRMVNNLREHPKESLASLGKEGLDKGQAITEKWRKCAGGDGDTTVGDFEIQI